MNRLFVAIALPDAVRAELARLRRGLPGARWVPEENFHLTLRFIGEVNNVTTDEIAGNLDHIREMGFDMALDGFGVFESKGKARALWVGVKADEALVRLQRKVEQAVAAAGLEREPRKFKPHVTLARLKDTPHDKLSRFMFENSPFHCGPFPVGSFTLFRSFLNSEASVYRPEAVFPLDGGGFDDPYFDEYRDEETDESDGLGESLP